MKDFVEELCMEDFDLQIGGDFAKHLGVEGVEDHSNQKECTFKAQGCCTPDQQCTQGTTSGCKGLLQGLDMLHETCLPDGTTQHVCILLLHGLFFHRRWTLGGNPQQISYT